MRDLSGWRSERGSPYPVHYLRGVIASLDAWSVGVKPGVELVVAGDLPHGIGISSSAALCVALVQALSVELPSPPELVLIAQEAEHRAGSPCGTMDQSASVFGGLIRYDGLDRRGRPHYGRPQRAAIRRRQFRSRPHRGDIRLPGASPGDSERLVAAAGRDGKAICRPWARWTGRSARRRARSLSTRDEPVLALRVRHVVTESQRVRDAEHGDRVNPTGPTVGRLMTESGRSSATDYDISHPARRAHRVDLPASNPASWAPG